MPYWFQTTLLFFAVLLPSSWAALPTVDSCILLSALSYDQKENTRNPKQLLMAFKKRSEALAVDVRFLGAGIRGGAAFKVQRPDNIPYVLKFYYTVSSRNRDHDLFTAIRPYQSSATFLIPEERLVLHNAMMIDYIEGDTVRDKIFKLGVETPEAIALALEFNKRVDALIERMQADPELEVFDTEFFDGEEYSLQFFGNSEDDQTKVAKISASKGVYFVKSDNVIITDDGDFVLIDPY